MPWCVNARVPALLAREGAGAVTDAGTRDWAGFGHTAQSRPGRVPPPVSCPGRLSLAWPPRRRSSRNWPARRVGCNEGRESLLDDDGDRNVARRGQLDERALESRWHLHVDDGVGAVSVFNSHRIRPFTAKLSQVCPHAIAGAFMPPAGAEGVASPHGWCGYR